MTAVSPLRRSERVHVWKVGLRVGCDRRKRRLTLEPAPLGILASKVGAPADVICGRASFALGSVRRAMQFGHGRYRIGEISERTGLTPDALRYYERLGLLPRFRRSAGGFRIYTSDVVERVRFIKQTQTVGLSLDEIRELVRRLDHGGPEQRSEAMDLVVTKLAEVDAKLGELRELRRTLKGYLERPRSHRRSATTERSETQPDREKTDSGGLGHESGCGIGRGSGGGIRVLCRPGGGRSRWGGRARCGEQVV